MKALQRFGGRSVLEVVAPHDRGTLLRGSYREVQGRHLRAPRVPEESTKGIATPKGDLELVRQRLVDAERHHRERHQPHREEEQNDVEASSGNVSADLSLSNPEQDLCSGLVSHCRFSSPHVLKAQADADSGPVSSWAFRNRTYPIY
ncbi:MAG TPA: hypothetical protein VG538_09980 [Vicinamibacterales bacterium]|nr:hypothetical protein [Vicinamibacterales bacterium]